MTGGRTRVFVENAAPGRKEGRRLSRAWRWGVGLLLLLGASLMASVAMGAVSISMSDLPSLLLRADGADASQQAVVWELRLPRALLAAMVGAGLASAGVAFQALFRNALADPYVVGASSGAAFGATLALTFGFTFGLAGLGPVSLAAFLGAMITVFAALFLTEHGGQASVASLLLAGSALAMMLSAGTAFLLLWRSQPWFQAFNWLLGSFSGREWSHVIIGAPYLVFCFGVLWLLARPLDALTAGDEVAQSLGLSVRWIRIVMVSVATLAAAVAVALAGVIGFVGLVAPHVARLIFGASHRTLLPMSALIGAILLVWSDILARTVLAPVEVPVGIITAALGGPFFLYVLKARGGRLA